MYASVLSLRFITAFYQLKVDTDIQLGNRTKAVTHHIHDACVHTSEAQENVSILRTEANGKYIAHHWGESCPQTSLGTILRVPAERIRIRMENFNPADCVKFQNVLESSTYLHSALDLPSDTADRSYRSAFKLGHFQSRIKHALQKVHSASWSN